VRDAATICPRPCKLIFDLLTLKMVSESRVTWPTSVPILVFIGLSGLDLGPMYSTDRQTSDTHHRLMHPPCGGFIAAVVHSQIRHVWYIRFPTSYIDFIDFISRILLYFLIFFCICLFYVSTFVQGGPEKTAQTLMHYNFSTAGHRVTRFPAKCSERNW